MISHVTRDFRACFDALPAHVKRSARRAYLLWKGDPNRPGLKFRRVGQRLAVFSVRVGIGWRAGLIGFVGHVSLRVTSDNAVLFEDDSRKVLTGFLATYSFRYVLTRSE